MKIFEIISKHCNSVEKASIDEAYLDLTDQVLERIKNGATIEPKDLKDSFVVGSYALEMPEGLFKKIIFTIIFN